MISCKKKKIVSYHFFSDESSIKLTETFELMFFHSPLEFNEYQWELACYRVPGIWKSDRLRFAQGAVSTGDHLDHLTTLLTLNADKNFDIVRKKTWLATIFFLHEVIQERVDYGIPNVFQGFNWSPLPAKVFVNRFQNLYTCVLQWSVATHEPRTYFLYANIDPQ